MLKMRLGHRRQSLCCPRHPAAETYNLVRGYMLLPAVIGEHQHIFMLAKTTRG